MSTTNITGALAAYMAGASFNALPEEVREQTKLKIIDTIAAMISGSKLRAGQMAQKYITALRGNPEATVVATGFRTTAVDAALANAMFAHADETDDFEPTTKAHPGSHVVPAALAMAERCGSSGDHLIAATALGYDLSCRFLLALDPIQVRRSHRSAEGISSTMGAVGATGLLARLSESGMRFALSYAAQQVSGIWSWVRDSDHVEKAFDFSGMGARNGVTAAIMADMGFTGVWDVFDGEHNALIALSSTPQPEKMVEALGQRYFVAETSIKPHSVGYPIQAPLSAFLFLKREHRFSSSDILKIRIRLPEDGARIVNDRAMPNVNCQHIIALALIDGDVSFATSHDHERMKDKNILRARQQIELIGATELMDPTAPRSGSVEVTLRNGSVFEHFVRHAPGTKENPMSRSQVYKKAQDLIEPILGVSQTDSLLECISRLEKLEAVTRLTALIGG